MSENSRLPEWLSGRLSVLLSRMRPWDLPILFFGLSMIVLQHGMVRTRANLLLGALTIAAIVFRVCFVGLLAWQTGSLREFWNNNRRPCLVSSGWTLSTLLVLIVGPVLPVWHPGGRLPAIIALSEFFLLVSGCSRFLSLLSRLTRRSDPAAVFVLSFLGLILMGTLLLLLPGSHSPHGDELAFLDQCRVALFTATSASCVTGLVVVPTGGAEAHWSRFGQVVILVLMQLGGLGIMSLSALFAMLGGRGLAPRDSAALSEVTESISPRDVRRLLLSIVGLTMTCELIGAVLLSTLWPELPVRERAFYGLFHSVSAFCNAGFALTENSYVGMGLRWQVWGISSLLIILGGLGFGTISSFAKASHGYLRDLRTSTILFRRRKFLERLTLAARLVCTTTALLLLAGMLGYWLLESGGSHGSDSFMERLAEGWFQSVTFRTAGFNTVDHAELQPGTKLFAIGLMFIGASPGSTGGGIKTMAFAVLVFSLRSLLRGRRHVEVDGRSIPEEQVRQAFAIATMGVGTVMITTLLLLLFEQREAAFLNYLFEATSAFATVGVSAGVTPGLSGASQLVLVVTMFLGRVGPLTALFALARQSSPVFYQYPEERVTLG